MTETYTWEEIKSMLVPLLEESRHILTFGTIGSCDIETDIDIIITKKAESRSSDFYGEVHALYEQIDQYLQDRYSRKLCVFSGGGIPPEQLILSEQTKGDLIFDTMTYVSLRELENHWLPYMPGNQIQLFLGEEYDCIIGDVADLFTDAFLSDTKEDHLHLLLMGYDKLNTKYPSDVLIECMNNHFDFILRKRLGLKSKKATSEDDLKRIFYQILDILDGQKIEK